jgi:Ca2+-binding RTX toxin-like protein
VNNLQLLSDPLNGTGNAIDNQIGGNSNDNRLMGLEGNDTLIGFRGSDTLDGGAGNDTLTGDLDVADYPHGPDHFIFDATPGSANADTITDFSSASDKIHLDGRVMPEIGPSGNFSGGDVRFYAAAGATGGHDADDRVVYDTSSGNLYYDADGNGSGAAQLIATVQTFGAVATLAATDIVVDNGTPTPTPTPTPGQSFSGTAGNDTIVGTSGNDTIYGNAGNDWLEGRGGNDLVSGGGGQDSYVFREFGAANADTLAQFDTAWDALRFDSSAFTGAGGPGHFTAGDARFYSAAGATGAHDADDRFVYNTSTGQLYYDADGAGGADAQLVATIQGAPTVAAQDIWVI